jgi:hypothetical protein
VSNLKRPAQRALDLAALLCCALGCAAPAARAQDSAVAGAPAAAPQVSESKDGFLSSLRQAFGEDLNKEVVRGHFDVGAAPNSHRYYCLVNPKSGKPEPNGVSGDLVKRRDGMTGIKNAAVTPLNCADAEQKGLLVTAGYTVPANAAQARAAVSAPAPAAAAPAVAPPAAAPPVVAAPAVATPMPAPAPVVTTPVPTPVVAPPVSAPVAVAPADGVTQGEIQAVFSRFISAQNARDRTAVGAVLLDSPDFVWAQYRGNSVFGFSQALDAFEQAWSGAWRLDPQSRELRIGSLAPNTAILVTPLLLTEGLTTVPVRWGGVFVRTKSGWRIASIFITPFSDWRPANR